MGINWPNNGEIDIVEGVNYQSVAKTALHTSRGCAMDAVNAELSTGTWDTAVGVPDAKTGIPDPTFRYANDCYVYNPQQWLNQGCVAVDSKNGGGSLGAPLNKKGGGVFVLEWDPDSNRIRSWVFTPHLEIPRNLKDSMDTTRLPIGQGRIIPNPDEWPLPYAYYPIGDGTSCPGEHYFRNMHIVLNLAFCGSVAGTRFNTDCPKQVTGKFGTRNEYIQSDPEELSEAYWKIGGVYIYGKSKSNGRSKRILRDTTTTTTTTTILRRSTSS